MIRRIATLTAAAVLIAAGAQIPRKAPEFNINLNGGRRLALSSYRGKGVVLAFILTTCSHCQATTGILNKLQAEYGARGLQVIESAIDQGAEAFVPRFVQQFGPTFPVGFNNFQDAQTFMEHSPMLIFHVPGLVFIDRQGNIVAQYEGDDPDMSEAVQEKNLRVRIEQVLNPTAAPAKTAAKKKS